MPGALVAKIKCVVFFYETEFEHPGLKRRVSGPGAPLTSVGPEGVNWHTQWYASAAAFAVGSVREHTASAKAVGNERRISVVVDKVAGCRHLRACLPVGQVTTGIGRRGVKLQRLKGWIFEVSHGRKRLFCSKSAQQQREKRHDGAGCSMVRCKCSSKA